MRTVILPIGGYLNSRLKKLWNRMILAKGQDMRFSTREEIGSHVIALDTIKRKLLFTKKTPEASPCLIVDLKNLETCSIKKEYHSIDAGELKTKKLHHFLKTVFLKLVYKNGSGTVSLPLFDKHSQQVVNIEQLEAQAKKWENVMQQYRRFS